MFKVSITSSRALRAAIAVSLFALSASLASAATLCVNSNGHGGCKSTIGSAIAAASAGDIISVAPGTYAEQVTITVPLSLVSSSPLAKPVINAKGKSNGIFINGMWATPNPGIANVVVSGFDVRNANYEGILVANASNVTLLDNHVHDNNKALTSTACPNIPLFETSEAMDCGEGIHFMAVDHSNITRNLVEDNSGGILISDETGPTWNNIVRGNIVRDNGYACGITMASHPAANADGPIKALNFGIMHNVISHNDSYHNGLAIPGAGAGVGIFAPGPGSTNIANVVIGNELHDNGLPGVTMHNHANIPGAPPVFFNDNSIIGNHIYGNAADTADAFTPGPTGINIYSAGPISGTVVSQNTFNDETIDIAFKAPAGSLDVHFNDFNGRDTGIANLGTGLVDATNNWWNCLTGPSSRCSSVTGPTITTAPWLSLPFTFNLDGY